MNVKYGRKVVGFVGGLFSVSMIFGCANYEVNSKRGGIPAHYIRYEMQEADRAVEAARQAGKDKACPAEFAAAEDAKNKAYDVFRACFTEQGAAMAKQATAKANALCPPSPVKPESKAAEPVVILASEPQVEEKVKEQVLVAAVEPKVVVLALEDIHFDFDQSTLKPEAKTILKRNIQLLKENPRAQIRVAGYTSAAGTEDYNQKLSERRANAIRDYLVSEGVIESDRLSTIGYGETYPAVHEAAPKDLYSPSAKANMRVLFEIVVK